MRSFICILLISFSKASLSSPDVCTYNTYVWNIYSKNAENYQQIQRPYSELTEEEIDELTGCTVCIEDQVEVFVQNIPPFRICKNIATDIKTALEESIFLGQTITEIVGHRVGKTKGDVDQFGNRTQFSNHSFGTAIDINPQFKSIGFKWGGEIEGKQKDFMHFSITGY